MLNRIVLMGRLVADPELRQTTNGIAVCSFRIAVDRNFASKSGERSADFIDIVAWRQTGEFVSRYFTKGKMIVVDGSLQSRNFEDKNGNKRTAYEVVADSVFFGESKSSSSSGSSAPAQGAASTRELNEPLVYANGDAGDFATLADDSSDLPF